MKIFARGHENHKCAPLSSNSLVLLSPGEAWRRLGAGVKELVDVSGGSSVPSGERPGGRARQRVIFATPRTFLGCLFGRFEAWMGLVEALSRGPVSSGERSRGRGSRRVVFATPLMFFQCFLAPGGGAEEPGGGLEEAWRRRGGACRRLWRVLGPIWGAPRGAGEPKSDFCYPSHVLGVFQGGGGDRWTHERGPEIWPRRGVGER